MVWDVGGKREVFEGDWFEGHDAIVVLYEV